MSWVVLAIAATVLGVWLGMAGADISPIFPRPLRSPAVRANDPSGNVTFPGDRRYDGS